jgi:hypothetical protein
MMTAPHRLSVLPRRVPHRCPHRYPHPLDLLLGAPERRPLVDVCLISRSVEIEAEEQVLDLALVAIIGGIMPQVSTGELR